MNPARCKGIGRSPERLVLLMARHALHIKKQEEEKEKQEKREDRLVTVYGKGLGSRPMDDYFLGAEQSRRTRLPTNNEDFRKLHERGYLTPVDVF